MLYLLQKNALLSAHMLYFLQKCFISCKNALLSAKCFTFCKYFTFCKRFTFCKMLYFPHTCFISCKILYFTFCKCFTFCKNALFSANLRLLFQKIVDKSFIFCKARVTFSKGNLQTLFSCTLVNCHCKDSRQLFLPSDIF